MNKQDLVNLVAAKTNLPAPMAGVAVDTVLGYLQQHLPAPIASQVSALLSPSAPGAGGAPAGLGDLAKQLPGGLGGMFK
jgi:hypothetical protein